MTNNIAVGVLSIGVTLVCVVVVKRIWRHLQMSRSAEERVPFNSFVDIPVIGGDNSVDINTAHVSTRKTSSRSNRNTSGTVVCLHGFPDTASTFDGLKHHLEALGYVVLAPSLPGYTTHTVDTNTTPSVLHFEATNLVEQLGVYLQTRLAAGEKFHLVGHDWGSIIAQKMALMDASRLLSLTLLAVPFNMVEVAVTRNPRQLIHSRYMIGFQLPHPVPEHWLINTNEINDIVNRWSPTWEKNAALDFTSHVQHVTRAMGNTHVATAALNYYRANIGLNSWFVRCLLVLMGGLLPIIDTLVGKLLLRCVTPLMAMHPMYQYRVEHLDPCFREKVLCLGGEDDGCCNCNTFPSDAIVVKNAAHWLHLEQPQQVHALISNHINNHRL